MSHVSITTESAKSSFESLPELILPLDKSIRFCGVANKLGYVIASRYRKNLEPLMTVQETEKYALFATIRNSTRQVWESKIGKVRYALTRYARLVRATVPLSDGHLLLISIDTDVRDLDGIMINKVLPMVEKTLG